MNYFVGEYPSSSTEPIEISIDEYKNILFSSLVITSLHRLELKFAIIIGCYVSFERTLFEIIIQHILGRPFSRDFGTEMYVSLNQSILALLTSVRTYHDQRPRHLREVGNGIDDLMTAGKNIFSEIYDSVFEYRFMEALRNYSQHHELPISSISIGSSLVTTPTNQEKHMVTFDPAFVVADLLSDGDLKSTLTREIEKTGIKSLT